MHNYIRALLKTVYPEIVKVYGEPLARSSDGTVTVTVYYAPNSSASMYLTLSGLTGLKAAAEIIEGLLGALLGPLRQDCDGTPGSRASS